MKRDRANSLLRETAQLRRRRRPARGLRRELQASSKSFLLASRRSSSISATMHFLVSRLGHVNLIAISKAGTQCHPVYLARRQSWKPFQKNETAWPGKDRKPIGAGT